jgi:hypothetical protein
MGQHTDVLPSYESPVLSLCAIEDTFTLRSCSVLAPLLRKLHPRYWLSQKAFRSVFYSLFVLLRNILTKTHSMLYLPFHAIRNYRFG